MKSSVLALLMALSCFSVFARAGEFEPNGAWLVAKCDIASKLVGNPRVIIYNQGDVRTPHYHVVLSWSPLDGPQKGFLLTQDYVEVKNHTIPAEEIHFTSPGFEMEVVTNLKSWSDGDLPGTDAEHPEKAVGSVSAMAGDQKLQLAPATCKFFR